jgi:uncharacterized protein (TIGR02453 family)
MANDFSGFPVECIDFFTALSLNNNKTWFDAHKGDYEAFVMEPARRFVTAMGNRLRELAPGIQADPRTNRSVFRIYRDTRFSKDKTPYKTHLAIFFWEGERPKMECPGFYFHFDKENLILGEGLHLFPKQLLEPYRERVVHPVHGTELREALHKIEQKGGLSIGGKGYKRVPRGYDPSHPNAELLLYNGLHVGETVPLPDELFSPSLMEYCTVRFRELLPIHRWLVSLTAS